MYVDAGAIVPCILAILHMSHWSANRQFGRNGFPRPWPFKPKQLKLALVLGAPPMNHFLQQRGSRGKGLPPLSPAPQIPAQPKPSLRPGRFQLTMMDTSCTIITPASLRSDCCSPSFRNAVRLPSGFDVHLHRNNQPRPEEDDDVP